MRRRVTAMLVVVSLVFGSQSCFALNSNDCGGVGWFANKNSCPGGGVLNYSVCDGPNAQFGVSNFGVPNNQEHTLNIHRYSRTTWRCGSLPTDCRSGQPPIILQCR